MRDEELTERYNLSRRSSASLSVSQGASVCMILHKGQFLELLKTFPEDLKAELHMLRSDVENLCDHPLSIELHMFRRNLQRSIFSTEMGAAVCRYRSTPMREKQIANLNALCQGPFNLTHKINPSVRNALHMHR